MTETEILLFALEGLFNWNKSRVECFAMIIMGMISSQSVNLANITCPSGGTGVKYKKIFKISIVFS